MPGPVRNTIHTEGAFQRLQAAQEAITRKRAAEKQKELRAQREETRERIQAARQDRQAAAEKGSRRIDLLG